MPFEFDGKKYIESSTHQRAWGARLISELNLRGDETILDLGCGDGGLTAQLAELVPHGKVVGIDASLSMIETARTHAGDNLEFHLMDINRLDFEDEFDLAFSNATLHWIKDHQTLMSNVYRSLKMNGIVRFNFAAEGNCSHFNRVVQQVMAQGRYARYFSSFEWPWYMPTVEEYEALLKKTPFRECSVWGENADRYFPNVEAMVRWIDQPSLVPFLKKMDEADRRGFRDAVVSEMVALARQDDGTCFETFRRINVLARK